MNQETKERLVATLRKFHLLSLYNSGKFAVLCAANAGSNAAFRKTNGGIALPPLRLAYDAYGHVSLPDYYATGRRHAEYLAGLIRKHAPPGPLKILEWGCGPARVIRHLPALLDGGSQWVGTDYNDETVAWCRENISGIRFESNELEPPLPIETGTFDCAYALSVLTHLSEAMHEAWRDELLRVLKPGGLLILTTHGAFYRERHLLPHEQGLYDVGQLVVRGGVKEGKKWFAAFHSPVYMRDHLLKGLEIVEHITRPLPGSIEQDVWVVRKSLSPVS